MIPLEVPEVIGILKRTPLVIRELLMGLEDHWLHADEGPDTWSAHSIVGHLIFGEQTDWIPRIQIIMGDQENKNFIPFDRLGHFPLVQNRSIESLLHQFEQLRNENLMIFSAMEITLDDLKRTGVHPAFGTVTLQQLISAWAVHDLTHISQIVRVMAKQYHTEVGPWKEYLGVLKN